MPGYQKKGARLQKISHTETWFIELENIMHTNTAEKVSPLNIRIKAYQRTLIEDAAEIADKTVSDFVREAAVREARDTLLDQSSISFTDQAWEEFTAALDAAPQNNPRLRDLVSRQPIWGS